MARSTYYYALGHPPRPTRPELWGKVVEVFGRTANGCGHRRIAMCLRAEEGVRMAGKTVLKMMREIGISCGIRRETDHRRYNSCKGVVGETFENVMGRDFAADGPWEKMGTDATEFKCSFGEACFAPAFDFGGVVDIPASEHGPAERDARHAAAEDSGRQASDNAERHGMAVPA